MGRLHSQNMGFPYFGTHHRHGFRGSSEGSERHVPISQFGYLAVPGNGLHTITGTAFNGPSTLYGSVQCKRTPSKCATILMFQNMENPYFGNGIGNHLGRFRWSSRIRIVTDPGTMGMGFLPRIRINPAHDHGRVRPSGWETMYTMQTITGIVYIVHQ